MQLRTTRSSCQKWKVSHRPGSRAGNIMKLSKVSGPCGQSESKVKANMAQKKPSSSHNWAPHIPQTLNGPAGEADRISACKTRPQERPIKTTPLPAVLSKNMIPEVYLRASQGRHNTSRRKQNGKESRMPWCGHSRRAVGIDRAEMRLPPMVEGVYQAQREVHECEKQIVQQKA